MHDYSSEISEDPKTSREVLLSPRSYCLVVQKHTLEDGCEAQTKTSHYVHSISNYLIMENNCMAYFSNYISYHSECSFKYHLNAIQSSLSQSLHPCQNLLNLMQESPHNPLSTLPPSPACIPQIQPDRVYVCPMNESIFSSQHCLNFQLKMSKVSPDRSEGPSIIGPLLAPSQAHVSATLFHCLCNNLGT